MQAKSYDILYIHPIYHQAPNQVPMGIVGLFNQLPDSIRKLGLYSDEATEQLIKSTQMIAMDLHWYFPLWTVEQLAEKYKQCNPDVKIILGGYTASIFAQQLSQNPNIDYVITGDAEKPFLMLVNRLMGEPSALDIDSIPNIVSKDGISKHRYCIDNEQFSNLCYSKFDWFPSFLSRIKHIHEGAAFHDLTDDNTLFPFIPINRGCPYHCTFCYGSPENTRKIFERDMVVRTSDAVKRDLNALKDSPHIPAVFFVGDFMDLLSDEWCNSVFDRSYHLDCYFEFFNLPSLERLEQMATCFKKCNFNFSLYREHGESEQMVDINHFHKILQFISRHPNINYYVWNPRSYYKYPAISTTFPVNKVISNEGWHIKVPNPGLKDREKEEDYKFFKQKSLDFWQTLFMNKLTHMLTGIRFDNRGKVMDSVDERWEILEKGKKLRGCIPVSVIDHYSKNPGEDRRLGALIAPNTTLFRMEPLKGRFNKGDIVTTLTDTQHVRIQHCNLCAGKGILFPSGDIHCNINAEMCDPTTIGSKEKNNETWKLLDLYKGGVQSLDSFTRGITQQGVMQFEYPFQTYILDSCKFAAPQCPALRLSRLIVNENGSVQTCFWGDTVGTVDDSPQVLLQSVYSRYEELLINRGCKTCEANGRCPKCIFPSPLSEKDYCSIMKSNPHIAAMLQLFQCLASMSKQIPLDNQSPQSVRAFVETSDKNVILMSKNRLSFQKRLLEGNTDIDKIHKKSEFNPALRFCQVGPHPALINLEKLEIASITEHLAVIVSALCYGGLDEVFPGLKEDGFTFNPGKVLRKIVELELLKQ